MDINVFSPITPTFIDCKIEGSLVVSAEGKIVYGSPGAACLLGITESELMAYTDSSKLIHVADRFIFKTWLSEARYSTTDITAAVTLRTLGLGQNESFAFTFRKLSGDSGFTGLTFTTDELSVDDSSHLVSLLDCSRKMRQAISRQMEPVAIISLANKVLTDCDIFDAVWMNPIADDQSVSPWPITLNAIQLMGNAKILTIQDKVLLTKEPVTDTAVHNPFIVAEDFLACHGSFMSIPLIADDAVYGLLNLFHSNNAFFNSQNSTACEDFARDISLALEFANTKYGQKEGEKKLRSNEIKLRQSEAVGGTGNFEIDFRTGGAVWSAEALRIYGLPEDQKEQSYENWLSFVHPEDLEAVKKLPFSKADPYDTMFSYRIVRHDGSIRHIAIHYEYEFNEKGRVIALFGTVHDITNMKAAESALLQSERNLRHIVDSIPQLIYGLDENGLFIFVNKSFAFFYGKKPAEIIGKSVADIVKNLSESFSLLDPDSRIIIAARNKSTRELELTNHKKERKIFTTVRVPYARSATGQKAILGVAYDITNQKKAENDRMLMLNDIESRNRDLEQFSYIVSHNLRSPVANIIGLLEELRTGSHDLVTKDLIKDKLLLSVQLLDQIIIDLNTILEIKGNDSEKKEMVRFDEVTTNIQTAILDIITAEEVQIDVNFKNAPEMFALKGYLYSIFQNLISNSIKYKQLDVVPIITIRTEQIDNNIVITYKDNGLGIDLKKRGQDVFGLYKRFHNHKPGKGLGLFMVKTQIEAMNGSINIKSKIGSGTTFTIVLPV